MKFSGRHDIEAPIDRVFAVLSDFDAHERSALRRGVQVNRIDMMTSPVPGMTWAAKVRFRGRIRDITVSLARFDPPEVIYYDVEGSGLLGQFTVDLVALSKARTRLIAALDVRPMSMSGRLINLSPEVRRCWVDGVVTSVRSRDLVIPQREKARC